jgi:aminotransferase in exopolysaccharide biosynthesis
VTTKRPTSDLARQVLSGIREVVGDPPAALHEPQFSGNEQRYVKECIDSTYVSSVGAFVDRFERDLAAFTGARYAVVAVNGTAALHMALLLAGVRQKDEVLVPALTFVATANACRYCGAIPHFVDSEERTLGVDSGKLRDYLEATAEISDGVCVNRQTGRVIRALVPMHVFGHPADLDGLLAVARDFRLALVEDAAESLGSTYHGRHTGTLGLLGALSFNGNKIITTGGGGAILTDDGELARRAKHLTTTAKLPHPWNYEHDSVGYNYRMPNLNAALGCAQLERIADLLAAKRVLFARYESAFSQVSGARLLSEPARCTSNYWLQTLLLDEVHAGQRDTVLAATNDAGFMTRPVWTLMNRLQHFAACPSMETVTANSLEQRVINLPSSSFLAANRP